MADESRMQGNPVTTSCFQTEDESTWTDIAPITAAISPAPTAQEVDSLVESSKDGPDHVQAVVNMLAE